MEEMKKRFAEKAAPMVKTAVEKTLNKEISQLRDDITSAREVNFGRRIFEAFANEFQTSYLMEKSEIAKLKKQIAHKNTELTEAQDTIAVTTTLVESKDAEACVLVGDDEGEGRLLEQERARERAGGGVDRRGRRLTEDDECLLDVFPNDEEDAIISVGDHRVVIERRD